MDWKVHHQRLIQKNTGAWFSFGPRKYVARNFRAIVQIAANIITNSDVDTSDRKSKNMKATSNLWPAPPNTSARVLPYFFDLSAPKLELQSGSFAKYQVPQNFQ